MVMVKCGWCSEEFDANVKKAKTGERVPLKCPHCTRIVSSSIKESTGKIVGRKHVHRDLKAGDVV